MAEAVSSVSTSVKGRPPVNINEDDIKYLLSIGFNKTNIAALLGISRKTLYNKISCFQDPSTFSKYSSITDAQLDAEVQKVKLDHPNDGEIMVAGHLLKEGVKVQRARLRASIHRVDPYGVKERQSVAIRRRQYHTDSPNSVWHIDGHHKLIKWRLVTHGGIDGYSRLITYLLCSSNNRADTVVGSFRSAVAQYGLPRKVRSDHGGENIEVWRYMMEEHCSESCIIVGSSTHNVRIERLWRDVQRSVVVLFANLFRTMEDDNVLDHLNEVDIYCLHYIFLPRINRKLNSFRGAWNNHSVSTEFQSTPIQMFVSGLIPQLDSSSEPESDSETPSTTLPAQEPVAVPRCSFTPCTALQQSILQVDPLASADVEGLLGYHETIQVCEEHLETGCNNCIC